MKFGEHLQLIIRHTPDWSRRFIRYGHLKHIIKAIKLARAAEERAAEERSSVCPSVV